MNPLEKHLEIKHHKVINGVANLISNKIEEALPGITLDYVGKRVEGSKISGSVVGTIITPDGEAARSKIREIISELRNRVVLKTMLKGDSK